MHARLPMLSAPTVQRPRLRAEKASYFAVGDSVVGV
jgi:hypothetical protein